MFVMLLISALVVGLSLGLLGAGGAILTVPTLVLLLGMNEKSAIASSLAIVSFIALTGIINAVKKGALIPKILGWFAVSSLPSASLGAYVGVLLPVGVQTLLLTLVMLIAAFKMVRSSTVAISQEVVRSKLLMAGALAGFVTGIVGIGGGFLLVPALVIYAGLTMQQAVANSLALIVINGGIAFVTLQLGSRVPEIDWIVIGVMAAMGSVAVLVGQKISGKLNQQGLKKGFAVLLVIVAISLLIKQFWI